MPDAQVLLFTDEIAAAAKEIDHHGGRLIHRLSDRAIIALLPEHAAANLEHATTEETLSLTSAERLLIDAWRERRASPPEGMAVPPASATELPDHPPIDAAMATQERHLRAGLTAAGYVPAEFSTVLRGSVGAGVVVVSGPTNDLTINDKAYQKELSQFMGGADFLATAEQRASVSFAYDPHQVTVNAPNNPRVYNDLYFPCQIGGHTFIFWQSQAGWAAVREIHGSATSAYFVDILELWSVIWNPDYRVYMPFTLTVGGQQNQYFLTANTTSGAVNIRQLRFDATTSAITVDNPAWSRNWNPQYTLYMPFTLTVAGNVNQYFLTANTTSGAVNIRQIRYDTATQAIVVDDPAWQRDWNPRYTVYMPFTLTVAGNVNQYFLTANLTSGAVNIRRIHYDGGIVVDDPAWSRDWNPQYTVYMPFTLAVAGNVNQYFLTANTTSGAVNIRQIRFDAATQTIVVDDPVWSRDWNPQYTIYVPFVFQGSQFFLTANTVNGMIIIRRIVYNATTKSIDVLDPTFQDDMAYERAEGPWRDAALQALGHRPGYLGVRDYTAALRASLNTNWGYVTFVTRYSVEHIGYAGWGRVVIQFEGKGAPAPDVTFAHESGHIFGAANEYKSSKCSLAASGYYQVQNRNCAYVNEHAIDCLMNENDWSICQWSRGQFGWVFFTVLAPFVLNGQQWIIGQDREIGHAIVQEIRTDGARPKYLEVPRASWSAEWNPDYQVYMPFTLTVNGVLNQYFLTANTTSGTVGIRPILYDNKEQAIVVGGPAWSRDWNPQYTVYMPFTLTVNGDVNQYFLTANTTSGAVNIRQIRYDLPTQSIVVDDPTWSRDWNPQYTVYMPFTLTVNTEVWQFFLTANLTSGAVNIRRIRFDKVVVVDDPTWSRNWNPLYTVYMPFTLTVNGELNQYFLTANTTSGALNIRRIWYDLAAQAIVVDDPVWSQDWNPRYTIYVPFLYKGTQYFLSVNNAQGRMNIRPITAPGGKVTVNDPVWELP